MNLKQFDELLRKGPRSRRNRDEHAKMIHQAHQAALAEFYIPAEQLRCPCWNCRNGVKSK